MKTLAICLAVIGLASADVSLGYKYNIPQTSYGVPAHQIGDGSGQYNTGSSSSHTGLNTQVEYQDVGNSGYQSIGQVNNLPLAHFATPAVSSGHHHSSSNSYSGAGYQTSNNGAVENSHYKVGASAGSVAQPVYQYAGSSGFQTGNNYQTSNQYQAAYLQKYQESYRQQPTQVFKHFYVHAAPEEPEVPKFRQPPVLPPPQKHYKIIFIKTPTPPAPAPQFIPVQQQNEEKTIVYVLVKKPEEAEEVVIPKVAPKPPSKPEVFFIKYNGKDDSQAVINNIVSDYNKGHQGGSVGYSGAENSDASVSTHVVENNSHSHSVDLSASDVSGGIQSGVSGGSVQNQNVGIASGEANVASVSYQGGYSSGNELAHNSHLTGETQNQENYSSVANGQEVPHQTYGLPKFRLH